ncbi:MAG: cell surface protein [Lentisphaeria bacterium]|nr:cell surface protein [Lentisphaeria bacterium]
MKNAILLLLLASLTIFAAPVYLSPTAFAQSNDGFLYVAEETAKQVAVVSLNDDKIIKTFSLKFQPRALAITDNGKTLLAAGGEAQGQLGLIDTAKGKVKTVDVGHTPTAIAVYNDIAYIANRFDNTVSAVDLKSAKVIKTVPAGREPHGVAVGDNGSKLFVVSHQPIGPANGDYIAISVFPFALPDLMPLPEIKLPNGCAVGRKATASPDGKFIYTVHALARYQLPTTQLERGWMTTNAISIIDATTTKFVNSVLIDDVELGAANPWDVSCSPDGKTIAVASAGSNEISVIDRLALHDRLAKAAKNEKVTAVTSSADSVPNDLSFLVGIRKRFKVKGIGPRAVFALNDKIYAAEYFTDSLAVIRPAADPLQQVKSIPLGPKQEMTAVRKGEMLFNSAEICFQNWQSCATCHPDGRADGLNWDLINDGMGNPKQTKSLLLSHKTPPTMISGIRKDAETCVRSGIRYIQFAVRPPDDAEAIDEYCKAIAPVESPYLVKGKLSPAAQRGEKIYLTAGCVLCHPLNDLMTDLKQYDLGMQDPMDAGKKWDTPTLREIWRTAPYMFDGRSATMMDVLTKHNPNDIHGKTSQLTKEQLADLEAFILSH